MRFIPLWAFVLSCIFKLLRIQGDYALKKLAFILAASILLGACSDEEATPEVEAPETEVQEVESETIEVTMETEIDTTDNKATVTGNTNLPDGGELMTTVEGNDYRAQSKNMIENGSFISDTFSDQGDGLVPGTYTVRISLSIPSTQSDEFVEQAGKEYENLSGNLMEESDLGKSLSYETEFIIE